MIGVFLVIGQEGAVTFDDALSGGRNGRFHSSILYRTVRARIYAFRPISFKAISMCLLEPGA